MIEEIISNYDMDFDVLEYDLYSKYNSLCSGSHDGNIRQLHDCPQNSQSTCADGDADSTFSSSSGGTSHDELSDCGMPDLNRLIMLQRLSYHPLYSIGFHGPTYCSEGDSDYDIMSLTSSKISSLSSHLYDSYSSIELSLNSDWEHYDKPRLCRKQYFMSATTLESSHLKLDFTDTSGSELLIHEIAGLVMILNNY